MTLGDRPPVGDLGNRNTDARLFLAILAANGPVAELLRERGRDEAVVEKLMEP